MLAARQDDAMPGSGRGWRVFINELVVNARVGIHEFEYLSPQPIVLDADLAYRGMPTEGDADEFIDYDRYCERITSFLTEKPHTRLLEMLAVDLAVLSFREFGALDALTLSLYKPKIREDARRIGIELDWTRKDYLGWAAR